MLLLISVYGDDWTAMPMLPETSDRLEETSELLEYITPAIGLLAKAGGGQMLVPLPDRFVNVE